VCLCARIRRREDNARHVFGYVIVSPAIIIHIIIVAVIFSALLLLLLLPINKNIRKIANQTEEVIQRE
jgi:hypothetical protein